MFARSNPLAPGVYWIDVTAPFASSTAEDKEAIFRGWLQASGSEVRELNTEPGETILPGGIFVVWHSFEVLGTPAPFPFTRLGFPTVVKLASSPGGVTRADRATSKSDVVQVPAPGGLGDFMGDLQSALAPALDRYLPLIVFGVALYLWAEHGKGHRNAVY